jgi:acyl carrier protein
MPVKAGFAALDDAMIHADVTIMPARLDLAALSRAFPTETDVPPVFRSLVQRGARPAAPSTKTEANLLVRLNGLPEAERKSVILSVVREEVATVLGLTPFEVGVDLPLRSLGLDSLMAVELKNRLTRKFDATLPTTLAFDYPTANAIAGLVREKLKLDLVRAWSDTDVRGKLERISIAALRASGVLDLLMDQPEDAATAHSSSVVSRPDVNIDAIEHDSLLELMESMLGTDNG